MIFKHIIQSLLTVGLAFVIVACQKNYVSIERDIQEKAEVISLQLGNEYYFNASMAEGNYYTDWYYTKTIEKDTIINGFKYYKYIDNSYIRVDGDKVLENKRGNDIVKFDYTVSVGDTINYNGNTLIVEEILEQNILNSPCFEKVYKTSNKKFNPKKIIHMIYATRFGLIAFRTEQGNRREGYGLIGAFLNNKKYGRNY